jgi:hypothetical protein
MLSEGRNCTLQIRREARREEDDVNRKAYVVQICGTELSPDDNFREPTGTLRFGESLKRLQIHERATEIPIKSGEWFRLEVIAVGNRIRVLINGTAVVDCVDPAKSLPSGSIGIFCRWGATIKLSNLEIKEHS